MEKPINIENCQQCRKNRAIDDTDGTMVNFE